MPDIRKDETQGGKVDKTFSGVLQSSQNSGGNDKFEKNLEGYTPSQVGSNAKAEVPLKNNDVVIDAVEKENEFTKKANEIKDSIESRINKSKKDLSILFGETINDASDLQTMLSKPEYMSKFISFMDETYKKRGLWDENTTDKQKADIVRLRYGALPIYDDKGERQLYTPKIKYRDAADRGVNIDGDDFKSAREEVDRIYGITDGDVVRGQYVDSKGKLADDKRALTFKGNQWIDLDDKRAAAKYDELAEAMKRMDAKNGITMNDKVNNDFYYKVLAVKTLENERKGWAANVKAIDPLLDTARLNEAKNVTYTTIVAPNGQDYVNREYKGEGATWALAAKLADRAKYTYSKADFTNGNFGSFVNGFGREVSNEDNYSFGLQELLDQQIIDGILEKIEKKVGKNGIESYFNGDVQVDLTDAESAVIRAYAWNVMADMDRAGTSSVWSDNGEMTGQSVAMMAEYAPTGAIVSIAEKGMGMLAKKAIMAGVKAGTTGYKFAKMVQKVGKFRDSLKRYGERTYISAAAKEKAVKEGLHRGVGRAVADAAVGVGEAVTDAVVGGALQSELGGRARAMEEKASLRSLKFDDKGKIVIDRGMSDQEYAEFWDGTIEVMSERSGDVTSRFMNLFGISSKLRGTKFQVFANLGNALFKTSSMLKAAGFHGTFEEVTEEMYGELGRYVLGLRTSDDLENFFSAGNLEELFVGFSAMSIIPFATGVGSRIKANANLNGAVRDLNAALADAGVDIDVKGFMASAAQAYDAKDMAELVKNTLNGVPLEKMHQIIPALVEVASRRKSLQILDEGEGTNGAEQLVKNDAQAVQALSEGWGISEEDVAAMSEDLNTTPTAIVYGLGQKGDNAMKRSLLSTIYADNELAEAEANAIEEGVAIAGRAVLPNTDKFTNVWYKGQTEDGKIIVKTQGNDGKEFEIDPSQYREDKVYDLSEEGLVGTRNGLIDDYNAMMEHRTGDTFQDNNGSVWSVLGVYGGNIHISTRMNNGLPYDMTIPLSEFENGIKANKFTRSVNVGEVFEQGGRRYRVDYRNGMMDGEEGTRDMYMVSQIDEDGNVVVKRDRDNSGKKISTPQQQLLGEADILVLRSQGTAEAEAKQRQEDEENARRAAEEEKRDKEYDTPDEDPRTHAENVIAQMKRLFPEDPYGVAEARINDAIKTAIEAEAKHRATALKMGAKSGNGFQDVIAEATRADNARQMGEYYSSVLNEIKQMRLDDVEEQERENARSQQEEAQPEADTQEQIGETSEKKEEKKEENKEDGEVDKIVRRAGSVEQAVKNVEATIKNINNDIAKTRDKLNKTDQRKEKELEKLDAELDEHLAELDKYNAILDELKAQMPKEEEKKEEKEPKQEEEVEQPKEEETKEEETKEEEIKDPNPEEKVEEKVEENVDEEKPQSETPAEKAEVVEDKPASKPKSKPSKKAKTEGKSSEKKTDEPKDARAEALARRGKKDAGIDKFYSNDDLRPVFQGTTYRNGYAYATDTHIMTKRVADYDEATEGKTIDKFGNEKQGTAPNFDAVIPDVESSDSGYVKLPFDAAKMQNAINELKNIRKAFMDERKGLKEKLNNNEFAKSEEGKKAKDRIDIIDKMLKGFEYKNNVFIRTKQGDILVNAKRLKLVIDEAQYLGIKDLYIRADSNSNPLLWKDDAGQAVLLMPMMAYNTAPYDTIDSDYPELGKIPVIDMTQGVEFSQAVAEPYTEMDTEEARITAEQLIDQLSDYKGLDVELVSQEEAQRFAEGAERQEAEMMAVEKAEDFIKAKIKKSRSGSVKIDVPSRVNVSAERIVGHKIKEHRIDIGGLNHAYNNHGEGGNKITSTSIPLTKENIALAPYIICAPTRIRPGGFNNGNVTVIYEKDLSNGKVVYVEAQYGLDGDVLVSKNMWADLSNKVVDARKNRAPKLTSDNVILAEDIAKIRQDAENAIRNDVNLQKDSKFLDAISRGDLQTAKEMVAEASKSAMPNTKVVDESGNPMVMYHGTQLAELYVKDGQLYVRNTDKFYTFKDGKGFFTTRKEDAEQFTGGRKDGLYPCYLNIENPFILDCKGNDWDAISGYENEDGYKYVTTDYIVRDIMQNHPEYDGVILKNVMNENSGGIKHAIDDYIPFKANQIKSADPVTYDDSGNVIPLSKRFNKENNDIRFQRSAHPLRTPNGVVYGWSQGDKIYLTPEGINPNTPIHEYAHLWSKAVQKNNPELWDNITTLAKQTPIWEEVVNDPAYQNLSTDDEIASEVVSRLSGRNGAKKLIEMAKQMRSEGNDKAVGLLARMKAALTEFWHWVGENLFNIKQFHTADEIADRVLYDLINKTDLKLDSNTLDFNNAEFSRTAPKNSQEALDGMRVKPVDRPTRNERRITAASAVAFDLAHINPDPYKRPRAESESKRAMTAPMRTFDMMMRKIGVNAPDGKGEAWHYFVGEWHKADELRTERENAITTSQLLKANEIMGSTDGNARKGNKGFRELQSIGRGFGTSIHIDAVPSNGIAETDINLDQSQCALMYAWSKQRDTYDANGNSNNDGCESRFRNAGISEEMVDKAIEALDPQLKEYVDWVQEELLPSLWEDYLDGKQKDNIENYFPFVADEWSHSVRSKSGFGSTGSGFIKPWRPSSSRQRSNKGVTQFDVVNNDFFDMLANHIRSNERAYSLDELIDDMTYVFGGNSDIGIELKKRMDMIDSKTFSDIQETCQIAVGQNFTLEDSGSTILGKMISNVVASNINGNYHSALKQLLSQTTYAEFGSGVMKRMLVNASSPVDTWRWVQEKFPTLADRFAKGTMGNEYLGIDAQSFVKDMSSEKAFMHYVNTAFSGFNNSILGRKANVFFDFFACATGAKSVYEITKEQKMKEGMSEEQADEEAKWQALRAVNESQQSQKAIYMSSFQMSGNYVMKGLSAYQNSQFSWGRKIDQWLKERDKLKRPDRVELVRGSIKYRLIQERPELADDIDTLNKIADERVKSWQNRNSFKRLGVMNAYMLSNIAWKLGGTATAIISRIVAGTLGNDADDDDDEWYDMFTTSTSISNSKDAAVSILGGIASTFLGRYVGGSLMSNWIDATLYEIVGGDLAPDGWEELGMSTKWDWGGAAGTTFGLDNPFAQAISNIQNDLGKAWTQKDVFWLSFKASDALLTLFGGIDIDKYANMMSAIHYAVTKDNKSKEDIAFAIEQFINSPEQGKKILLLKRRDDEEEIDRWYRYMIYMSEKKRSGSLMPLTDKDVELITKKTIYDALPNESGRLNKTNIIYKNGGSALKDIQDINLLSNRGEQSVDNRSIRQTQSSINSTNRKLKDVGSDKEVLPDEWFTRLPFYNPNRKKN